MRPEDEGSVRVTHTVAEDGNLPFDRTSLIRRQAEAWIESGMPEIEAWERAIRSEGTTP